MDFKTPASPATGGFVRSAVPVPAMLGDLAPPVPATNDLANLGLVRPEDKTEALATKFVEWLIRNDAKITFPNATCKFDLKKRTLAELVEEMRTYNATADYGHVRA